MATNLNLPDELIAEVQRMGNFRTKRAAVTAALEEYIQRRKRLEIIDLFGTIEYDEDWDPRVLRGKAPLPAGE